MRILCVIPARLASTRLPRKPLALLQGRPIIEWTYQAASQCDFFTQVVVATDSEEVQAVVAALGAKVVMTDPTIQTGTDRVARVAQQFPDMDVVVNLQGDEPFVTPDMLRALVAPYLAGERPVMTTLANPLDKAAEYHSPAKVKVVVNLAGDALYFSRAPIPFERIPVDPFPVYHHQGMYAFTAEFLQRYAQLPQTPLELAEQLEQLRALEHGYAIRVCVTPHKTLEINTPEELAEAQQVKIDRGA